MKRHNWLKKHTLGLAAALLFDDENRKAESVMFRNEFVSALEDAAPAVPDYGEE